MIPLGVWERAGITMNLGARMKRLVPLLALLLLPGLARAGAVSVGATPVAMVGVTRLTNMHTVVIQNQGASDIRCQPYNSTGLTASVGYLVTAGNYASFDRVGTLFEIYCIATTGTQTVWVMQLQN